MSIVTKEDALNAYKQLKSYLYYENLQLSADKLLEFERDFDNRINIVLNYINSSSNEYGWADRDTFFTIVKDFNVNDEGLIFTNVRDRWESIKNDVTYVSFRIISDLSIETHLASIIWINKVAVEYEASLSSSCYGTRLVKSKSVEEGRLFTNYLYDYRNWQVNGINAIKEQFNQKKDVIAITADIKSFYHNVDYRLIKDATFYSKIQPDIVFSTEYKMISEKVFALIDNWSRKVYNQLSESEKKNYVLGHVGLPIGLSLSKVFANLILKELDETISDELSPVYYGRYVDDIFLVINSNPKIKKRMEFWKFLQVRMGLDVKEEDNIRLNLKNAANSNFTFNKSKEKFFYLDKRYGSNLIKDIEEELNRNSSEWRFVPENGEDLESLAEELLTSSSNETEPANSLRKSDGVSIRRLKFAHYLSALENYVEDHPIFFWKEGLKKLAEIVNTIIIEPFIISSYIQYLPRFLKLLKYSKQDYLFNRIENSLDWTCLELETLAKKDMDNILLYGGMVNYLKGIVEQSKKCGHNFIDELFSKEYKGDSLEYFLSDLHFLPIKTLFTDDKLFEFLIGHNLQVNKVHFPNPVRLELLKKIIDHKLSLAIKSPDYLLIRSIECISLFGLFYYTRPLSVFDISQAVVNFIEHKSFYVSLCKFYDQQEVYPEVEDNDSGLKLLGIPTITKNNPTAVLPSYLVEQGSWDSSVRSHLEPDVSRLTRLYNLMNDILRCDKKADLIVFPELCLKEYSIKQIYRQIRQSEVIFAGGLDYKFDRISKTVVNRMVYLLPIKKGRRIYHLQLFQEKAEGAIHEIEELRKMKGLNMITTNPNKYIVKYRNFSFASLICNEFLDINYRTDLRGKIDALLLLEWNQDLTYYNSLVESAANDLHAFIVQVNNRCFGDTRLRGPYKEDYKRDIARVRGGEVDYFVVAKLDVKELRDFQNYNISPTGKKALFKRV